MKKICFVLIFSCILTLISVSISHSQWTITQLTNDSNGAWLGNINNNGYVVRQGSDDDGYQQIFLYDGSSITQLTYGYSNSQPQINDNGYVVWRGGEFSEMFGGDIFLYDGSAITQLTTASYDIGLPQINNKNHVVWYENSQIFFYDGTAATQLTCTNCAGQPKINDNDYVVFEKWVDPYGQILLATPSPAPEVKVTVLSPNGGEVLKSGSVNSIEWETFGATRFDLAYSTDNGARWEVITEQYVDTTFNLRVPSQRTNKTRCLVKVTGYDSEGDLVGSDTSDKPFTIKSQRREHHHW